MNPHCKVLVVDDDLDTREALASALDDAGFLVEQAASGHEALSWVESRGVPDVILLDLHMPGIGGDEVMRRLRGASCRVILLTADSSARVLQFARDAKLLQKPVGLDELEAAVKEACAAGDSAAA